MNTTELGTQPGIHFQRIHRCIYLFLPVHLLAKNTSRIAPLYDNAQKHYKFRRISKLTFYVLMLVFPGFRFAENESLVIRQLFFLLYE